MTADWYRNNGIWRRLSLLKGTITAGWYGRDTGGIDRVFLLFFLNILVSVVARMVSIIFYTIENLDMILVEDLSAACYYQCRYRYGFGNGGSGNIMNYIFKT